MPKKTFLQLDSEKQSRFLEAALKEFSTKEYQQASISAVVETLGIAKGSVYQYFNDKKDLYLYLLEKAAELKFSYVQKEISGGYTDFWDLFRKMFVSGIAFDLENPRQSSLLLLSSQEKQVESLKEIAIAQKRQAWTLMQDLLTAELNAGRLRSDIPIKILAWQVIAISVGIAEYLSLEYGINYIENAQNNKPSYALSSAEIMQTVDYVIDIFKNGMLKQ